MTSSRGRPQPDRELVDNAAADALRRISRRSVAWWRTRTETGRTRAESVADLVATIARLDQRVEGVPAASVRVPPPPVRPDVLVDQLAVVTYDLRLALDARPDERAAAEATAHLVLTAYEVDPRPVPAPLLDVLLAAGLGPLQAALQRLPRERQP